jgi:hypothetical protein
MTQRLSNILTNNNPSIYLYGSVVLDDFRFGWSDIDFMCLTEEPITQAQAEELVMQRQTLLSEYPGNQYFRSFEGIITTWDIVSNHTNGTVVYWGTSGQRIIDSFSIDAFSLIEIIKYGQLLYGEDKRDRLKYPSHSDIHNAVEKHYRAIRKYAVETNDYVYSAGWLLDIARCLYSLKTDDVISKTEAGRWAINNNLSPEPEILKKAVMIRENPLKYKDDAATKSWLASLGFHIQLFADMLGNALDSIIN